jgi:3-oxoacyl-[acyl-carrier protein] reductase
MARDTRNRRRETDMRLEGKVAIITGAGRGIGKETAKLFVEEGAKVTIMDLGTGDIKAVCAEVDSTGSSTLCIDGDVTKKDDVKRCVDQTLMKFGRVDILINNAGIIRDAFVSRMTEQQWDDVLHVDLKGAFHCVQAVADTMMNQGSGSIINASSVSGVYGNIGQANYAAAKAGLIGMTKALSKELGKKGVRVNAVAPGFIQTPMTAQVPQKILDMMKEKTPLKKLGEPIDVAYAYLYLASDEAKYVNGTVLFVDGGLVI